MLACDATMVANRDHWFVRETIGLLRRTLQRLDVSSRSLFAVIDEGSCFAGTLFELALAADRSYMLAERAAASRLPALNFAGLEMVNGRTRLATRFNDEAAAAALEQHAGAPLDAAAALDLGLVTFAPDELDWEDEIRLAIEERASLSPDALTGMEANLRFAGGETVATKIFGRLSAWQNWIFTRPNAIGENGALKRYGSGAQGAVRLGTDIEDGRAGWRSTIRSASRTMSTSATTARCSARSSTGSRIFSTGGRKWGRRRFAGADVYLRTATAVDEKGWASYGMVKMPEYRWGIFLADPVPDRRIGFGDAFGEPVWQQVPGEHRSSLRRLIVTQGDTEPASVEQQRLLGQTCPSLYDLRNLFQVNVEEGRHLWAMVYLLHAYFGRDGREEAEELLARHSGDPDKPRILGTFNEPIADWLSFFMFTYFTDRDGRFQLKSLAESAFDPLSRTCRFMLTEEAFHMFVGASGITRVDQAHARGHEGARQRRSRRGAQRRRDRSADPAALHQFLVQLVARPLRRRDLVQCRELFCDRHQRPSGRGAVRRSLGDRARACGSSCPTARAG